MMTRLILPDNPLFDETLATAPPPNWREYAATSGDGNAVGFVADASSGVLRPANWNDIEDYVWGGEWDERMTDLGWTEDELDEL